MARLKNLIDKHSDVLYFILIFSLCFGVLSISGNLFAGPRISDDNQIFRLQRDLSENGFIKVALNEIESRISPPDHSFYAARFVPLFCFVKVLKAKILGGTLLAWSAYMGLVNVFMAFFLFRFGKITGFSTLESMFFSLLVVVGEQSSVWWKLIHGEGLGMLCLAISLMCMGMSIESENRRGSANFCFLFFAILSTLSKESFILMLPALMFWRVWLTSEKHTMTFFEAVRSNIPFIAILSSVFFGELMYVKFSGGMTRGMPYAGWEGFHFESFMNAFSQFFQLADSRILLILILFLLLLVVYRVARNGNLQAIKTYHPRDVLLLLVLLFLIIFPQLLLHSKSGFVGTTETMTKEILFSRYLLPGMIGYAYAIIYILKIMREGWGNEVAQQKTYFCNAIMILSVLIVLVGIGSKLKNAYEDACVYAQRSKSIGEWLSSIASNTRESDKILIVCDPEYLYEIRRLDPILCEMLDRRNVEYHPAYATRSINKKIERLKEKMPLYAKAEYRVRDSDEIDAVVILGKALEEAFLNDSEDWFDPGGFRGYVLVGWLEEEKLSPKWNRKEY